MDSWLLYEAVSPHGKRYIGITSKTLAKREQTHRSAASYGSDISFHQALRRHGAGIVFTTLVVGPRDYIVDLEPKVIAAYQTTDWRFGYNTTPGGGESPMKTPSVVAKIAAKNTGKKRTPEQAARCVAHFPAIHTPEFYVAREAKVKALKATPEYKAKFRKTLLATYETKPELKANLSKRTRETLGDPSSALSIAMKARVGSPEFREYRRQVMIAYNADPAVKEARAAAWAAHRADPTNVPAPNAKKPK